MRRRPFLIGLAGALTALPAAAQDPYVSRRRDMVTNIEQLAAAGALGLPRKLDRRVLEAMREIPRHRFVPDEMRSRAYSDSPVPIGYEATISQPFMVATMTDMLQVKPGMKVLEVGTGSGYQAAILERLGAQVYTIEIVPQLAQRAAATLKALDFSRTQVRAGDGYKGWPEAAPFDRIMVTAGATHLPQPLFDQLKTGGRMLIPMGPHDDRQELVLVTKTASGRPRLTRLGRVMFVPLDERAKPSR